MRESSFLWLSNTQITFKSSFSLKWREGERDGAVKTAPGDLAVEFLPLQNDSGCSCRE